METLPDKKSLAAFIGKVSLFNKAEEAVLLHLAEKTIIKNYAFDEAIINKGDVGDAMFLILSGRLKVHDHEHQVATLETGELFGELSLLDREPRSMSVTALEPIQLGIIHRDDFFEVLEQYPGMTQDIISVLNKRLRNQNNYLISEYQSREEKLKELVNARTAEVMAQKAELEKKNALIAEKNKEMTDSLNYAKRLQAAILPREEVIKNSFDRFFVLYMPKDIVSGDFYFFEQIKNKTIIAGADCTGHGVAGAIMSMVGSSLLKQIILEKQINNPAEILNQLNDGVIEALKQSENHSHDGMDILLCTFDLENLQLEFAGANRPLLLIRDGILSVFPTDKFPIGGLQIEHSESYTKQNLSLKKDDLIYIFSDGYADQFGGELGKKLMTKKFKELLLSIHHQPMEAQGSSLHRFIIEWMGTSYEQVDDMLVIGIKI